MRGLRSFLLLSAVLVALGSYLYFVESRRDPLETTEKKARIFSVEADAIEEVTIKPAGGQSTTLRKEGSTWQITSPTTAQADAAEISGITTNLATLEEQRAIDENPGNLAEFGLAEPKVEISFKANGQDHRLMLGSKTPTGADIYARSGASPRVFLISSFLESTFNRSTFDLRDKTALRFDRDKADALEITTPGRTLRFTKTNGEWTIAEPAGYRSDNAAIEGLLSRINGLQMKAVADAEAEKKAGLENPAATVRIGTGSAQSTLLVGGPADEGTVYARDASGPAVFTVESSLLDDLKKDAGEFRQKDIFDARAFNTTRVEITRGTESYVFERKDDKWHQTAPAQKEADSARIEALLSALTGARADTFTEKPPAGAAELTVALSFDEGRKQERVSFYRSGTDAFATRQEGSGAAQIPTATLDEIVKAVEAVR